MFGKKEPKKKSITSDSYSTNTIQNGTVIEGNIQSEGNIRIDGRFEGTLSTNAKLVVGESGIITGTVKCENANIEGRVEGELIVNNLLVLKSKSTINGEINTNKLVVEEGAIFNGKIKTGNQPQLKNTNSNEGKEKLQKEAV